MIAAVGNVVTDLVTGPCPSHVGTIATAAVSIADNPGVAVLANRHDRGLNCYRCCELHGSPVHVSVSHPADTLTSTHHGLRDRQGTHVLRCPPTQQNIHRW